LRYLIFSDIHSNLEALEAVLTHAEGEGFDGMICLGDFVGYGANPDECVQRVASYEEASAVVGNHDAALLDPSERQFFNPVATAGILYSEDRLGEDSKAYLQGLPITLDFDGFMAVHSSPAFPEHWTYVLQPGEATEAFRSMIRPLAFIGHTHFPIVYTEDGFIKPFVPGDPVVVDSERKVLVNVGSVGQPRDGDSRAAYVIYDSEEHSVRIFRVEYDIDRAAAKILDAGLPPMLADRLRRGY